MADKSGLARLLDEARARTQAALKAVDPALEVSPGWTVKDVIAHLTAWDQVTTEALRLFIAGKQYDLSHYRSMDDFNAQAVAARADLPLAEVIAENEAARQDLKAALADTPPEGLDEELQFPWRQHGTISEMITIIAYHEQTHADSILARRGG